MSSAAPSAVLPAAPAPKASPSKMPAGTFRAPKAAVPRQSTRARPFGDPSRPFRGVRIPQGDEFPEAMILNGVNDAAFDFELQPTGEVLAPLLPPNRRNLSSVLAFFRETVLVVYPAVHPYRPRILDVRDALLIPPEDPEPVPPDFSYPDPPVVSLIGLSASEIPAAQMAAMQFAEVMEEWMKRQDTCHAEFVLEESLCVDQVARYSHEWLARAREINKITTSIGELGHISIHGVWSFFTSIDYFQVPLARVESFFEDLLAPPQFVGDSPPAAIPQDNEEFDEAESTGDEDDASVVGSVSGEEAIISPSKSKGKGREIVASSPSVGVGGGASSSMPSAPTMFDHLPPVPHPSIPNPSEKVPTPECFAAKCLERSNPALYIPEYHDSQPLSRDAPWQVLGKPDHQGRVRTAEERVNTGGHAVSMAEGGAYLLAGLEEDMVQMSMPGDLSFVTRGLGCKNCHTSDSACIRPCKGLDMDARCSRCLIIRKSCDPSAAKRPSDVFNFRKTDQCLVVINTIVYTRILHGTGHVYKFLLGPPMAEIMFGVAALLCHDTIPPHAGDLVTPVLPPRTLQSWVDGDPSLAFSCAYTLFGTVTVEMGTTRRLCEVLSSLLRTTQDVATRLGEQILEIDAALAAEYADADMDGSKGEGSGGDSGGGGNGGGESAGDGGRSEGDNDGTATMDLDDVPGPVVGELAAGGGSGVGAFGGDATGVGTAHAGPVVSMEQLLFTVPSWARRLLLFGRFPLHLQSLTLSGEEACVTTPTTGMLGNTGESSSVVSGLSGDAGGSGEASGSAGAAGASSIDTGGSSGGLGREYFRRQMEGSGSGANQSISFGTLRTPLATPPGLTYSFGLPESPTPSSFGRPSALLSSSPTTMSFSASTSPVSTVVPKPSPRLTVAPRRGALSTPPPSGSAPPPTS
ncbi:hypothetical protein B0H17DRAFT_1204854 [Mycena rosella]|uniref:Uncharacterized protein n=1 Tax=Mycena rosella TaxID=1033263 RepID=A0AAD7GDD1_MYCRO|nr:hypothetical protein B0H17DRAFT_1204854 [Mycena rosella]